MTIDPSSGQLDIRFVAAEAQPRSLAIDPGGRFLFVSGEQSGRLAMYEIDAASGELGVRQCYPVG